MADASTRRSFNLARLLVLALDAVVLGIGIFATIDGVKHDKPIALILGCAALVLFVVSIPTYVKIARYDTKDLP